MERNIESGNPGSKNNWQNIQDTGAKFMEILYKKYMTWEIIEVTFAMGAIN